jgi:hypothetical protein
MQAHDHARGGAPNAVIAKSSGDNLDGATWIANNMRQDAPPLLLWAAL